jgi:hypothetical protein
MNYKSIILATVLSSVVAYIVGMMSWMVLPFHNMTIDPIPNYAEFQKSINELLPATGSYIMPSVPMDHVDMWGEMERLHKEGPVGVIFIHKEGTSPMPPSLMAMGFVIDMLVAFIIAYLMSVWCLTASPGYWQRVMFSMMIGVADAIQSWAAMWNWMLVEWDYAFVMGMDIVMMWFFGGLVIAYFIKPTPKMVEE